MSDKTSNHLMGASSSYLSSAAGQPVNWYPWGSEALTRARREQKPILLDIGAVWCHWCHVMDRESYENHEIAAIVNRHFIAIKVDRDERPDIDARYQAAVSAMTRQGGWPLTAFLTPEGKPFFGGTYFPPDDQLGRPGFKRVLLSVAENFEKRRNDIEEAAGELTEALRRAETFTGAGKEFDPGQAVNRIVSNAFELFDTRHGGFGRAPKFPHPAVLNLLMEASRTNQDEDPAGILQATLEGMARGGVYDHLAGGFHRYSVDERWHVPHFEKMAYDNSELLKTYLHAFQVSNVPLFRDVAEGIIAWVNSDLSDQQRGGFYASQDADISLEDDGDHFTWTVDEARRCLSAEEFELVRQHFDLREQGDMHHNPARNVLRLACTADKIAAARNESPETVRAVLASARQKMLAARRQRPIPFIDRAVYVSWNGLFISAYLTAARVLQREDCRRHALRTLDRLLEAAWSPAWGFAHRCLEEGRVDREKWAGGGLEDQVYMVHALLDAFEAAGRLEYFDAAREAMDLCLRHHWDSRDKGFLDRPAGAPPIAEGLELPRKPFQDSPTPGANSMAAMALDRLYMYTLHDDYRLKARQTLEAFAGAAGVYGIFAASFGLAALLHSRHVLKVVIVGSPEESRTAELVQAANGPYHFGKAVVVLTPEQVRTNRLPAGLALTLPHLQHRAPVAVVCVGESCRPPITEPEELRAALAAAGT